MVNQNKGGLQGKRDLFGKTESNQTPVNLDIIQFNLANQQWELVSGVVGNAVQNGANVGTGEGVFKNRTADDLNFRTLVQNTEILLTGSVDEIAFSVGVIAQGKIQNLVSDLLLKEDKINKGLAGGYAGLDGSALLFLANIPALPISQITGLQTALDSKVETASNKGTGAFSFIQKTLTDLEFRSLKGNLEVLVGQNPLEVAFSIGAIAISKITGLQTALDSKIDTVVNVGTGLGKIFRDKVGQTINLKSIKAGTNISITNNADDITITNTYTPQTIPPSTFVLGFNSDKRFNTANRFAGIFTSKADQGTESFNQSSFPFEFTVKAISLYVPVNGVGVGGSDVVLRRNGVDIASTLINVATGVTGVIKVTGLTEVFAIDDLISIRIQQIGGANDLEDISYMLECEK